MVAAVTRTVGHTTVISIVQEVPVPPVTALPVQTTYPVVVPAEKSSSPVMTPPTPIDVTIT